MSFFSMVFTIILKTLFLALAEFRQVIKDEGIIIVEGAIVDSPKKPMPDSITENYLGMILPTGGSRRYRACVSGSSAHFTSRQVSMVRPILGVAL